MGPYGPGGLNIGFHVSTLNHSYMVDFTPLAWGLGFGRTKSAVQIRLLCFSVTVQHAIWDTEDAP